MLVTGEPGSSGEAPQEGHHLDFLVNDPTGMPPMCDEALFADVLENLVADEAPKVFAIVQEYGVRVDGRIAAWGMAFEDHAELVTVESGTRASLQKPENALRMFTFGTHIQARLVWVNPAAATPPEHEAA